VLVYLRKYAATGEEKKSEISYKQRGMSVDKEKFHMADALLHLKKALYVLFVMKLTISHITRAKSI
jgi:hypothetical protein